MTEISRDVENNILRNLFPEANQNLGAKILIDSKYRRDEIELHSPSYDDRVIQIASLKGTYCFRVRLRHPVLLLIPRSSFLLTSSLKSHENLDGTYNVGFFGAYVINLNQFTLFRVHGKDIRKYFPDYRNVITEDVCKSFTMNGGSPMELSSLNFLERNDSTSQNVLDETKFVVQKCFEYSYWRIPQYDIRNDQSTVNNFIYNNSKGITAYYSIFKTMVKIVQINDIKRDMHFVPHDFSYKEASVEILVESGNKFTTRLSRVLIAEPFASRLRIGDIVNCLLVSASKIYKLIPPPFIVIGIIGNELKTPDCGFLISIILWKLNRIVSYAGKLCETKPIDDIKKEVRNMIMANKGIFDQAWLENFDDMFVKSLKSLFPRVITLENKLICIPPTLIGYLLSDAPHALDDIDMLKNLSDLMNTIKMKNKFIDKHTRINLRTSEQSKHLQLSGTVNRWENLVNDIPRLANRIIYSRIFSQSSALS